MSAARGGATVGAIVIVARVVPLSDVCQSIDVEEVPRPLVYNEMKYEL